MAVTYMLTRDVDLSVQEEAAFGTSPGAVAGTDMFKHTSRLHYTPVRNDILRDKDNSTNVASVTGIQGGKESSSWKVDAEIIPSGDGTNITAPDAGLFIKACMGKLHAGTAHTVTVAGSAGTNLKLAVGGVAASGIAVGDLIAVDVSAAFGYEVRRVVALVGGGTPDDVTINAAFSADPAAARTVKLGTTYQLLYSAQLSLYLMQWINGTSARHSIPGAICQQVGLNYDFTSNQPSGGLSFSGVGKKEITHVVARPTPSTAGQPLVAAEGKFFVSNVLHRILTANLTLNSLTALRQNESGSLDPTGVKNTNNGSRWNVEAAVRALMTTGDRDTVALYDTVNATTPASIDAIVQLGITPGAIVAFAMPKWHARAQRSEQDGEFAVDFAGRALGTSTDDEVYVAFI